MATGGQQFRAQLGAWAKQTQANLDALVRQSAQEVASQVVHATPVDTGFLRGSWQPSIGKPASDDGAAALDPGGGNTQAKIGITAAGMKAGEHFYMTNNAAYALRLEYGFVGADSLGRNYNQAGRFFVGDTIKRWPMIVDEVAADLGLTK